MILDLMGLEVSFIKISSVSAPHKL